MRFPVIYFDKNFRHLELMKDRKLFSITNKLALKRKLLFKNKIVDCDGTLFEVTNVKKLKNVNPIWTFEFFNPMIRVEISTEKKGTMSLEKLKSNILKIFKSDQDFWGADGELEEKKAYVQNANTHEEIIQHMTVHFYSDHN